MPENELTLQIEIKESLSAQWSTWFAGFELTGSSQGGTCLCGLVPDQAGIFGILERIRDLNLRLVSVTVTGWD